MMCPSDWNPNDDLGQPFMVTIDGTQYAWDEDDVVWKGGPPQNDYDDGFRRIGTLAYEDEDEDAMAIKLTNYIKEISR